MFSFWLSSACSSAVIGVNTDSCFGDGCGGVYLCFFIF